MTLILNKIMNSFLSPLEQFKVTPIISLIIEPNNKIVDFTISNIVIYLFFNFLIICILVGLSIFKEVYRNNFGINFILRKTNYNL
jgi:hypothetical protein